LLRGQFLVVEELFLRLEAKIMKAIVYNQKGEEIETIPLSVELFNQSLNNALLHQVVTSQMSNRRQGTAHSKDRGDVSGGGKKPWRQKGTGRARHGSIRSPLWKGGGVTFGPKSDKNYKKNIPRKMKRQALLVALSSKANHGELIVIDTLQFPNHKTKNLKILFDKLPFANKPGLIILSGNNKNVIWGTKNITGLKTIQFKNLTALDVLSFKKLILGRETLSEMEKAFSTKR